jgi:hypothetical protein
VEAKSLIGLRIQGENSCRLLTWLPILRPVQQKKKSNREEEHYLFIKKRENLNIVLGDHVYYGENMPKPPYQRKIEKHLIWLSWDCWREGNKSTFSLKNILSSNRSDLNVGEPSSSEDPTVPLFPLILGDILQSTTQDSLVFS